MKLEGFSVTETSTNGGPRYQSEKVRVAIVGVGNCASSFVQGVEFYKDASPKDFVRIFEIACQEKGIPFEASLVEHLLEHVYRAQNLELRGCHPRDVINQALALASYRGEPRRLTAQLLDEACTSYFIEDHDADKSRDRQPL